MTIIAEYSDYAIQSVEYFISAIETGVEARDIKGLSNDKVELINITKEHPLVTLMAAQINPNGGDPLRSGLLPAISVTPGNMNDEAATMGKSPQTFVVDADWLTEKTNKQIQADTGLITQDQISAIITQYALDDGIMRCQKNMWGWNEEINISLWSDSPDLDILMSTVMDSILAKITVGFLGDESPVKNMKYRPTRGLTNFNFGRVLFGTEYNLTFFNTYHNYTIYQEDHIEEHDINGTFNSPGSEE